MISSAWRNCWSEALASFTSLSLTRTTLFCLAGVTKGRTLSIVVRGSKEQPMQGALAFAQAALRLGGGLRERRPCALEDRLAVAAEAGRYLQVRQLDNRAQRLGGVAVEHVRGGHDAALAVAVGVAGDEQLAAWDVEGDLAIGMSGRRQHAQPAIALQHRQRLAAGDVPRDAHRLHSRH